MARISLVYFDVNIGNIIPSFNHGLASIIGMLKNSNNKVSLCHLIDEGDFERTKKFLEKEKPDLIGLSFGTHQKKHVHNFLNIINPRLRLLRAS